MENLTGGTPPVRPLPCVGPCKLYFSLLSTFIGLIPDIIEFIGSIVNLFNGSFYLTFVSKIVTILTLAIGLIKTVLFILLGIKALNQGSITVPVVDDMTNKNTD